jgi:hypothetical protein
VTKLLYIVKSKNEIKKEFSYFDERGSLKKKLWLKFYFYCKENSQWCWFRKNIALHSPNISNIEVNIVGKVRRARIFNLRGLSGKTAIIAEKR